MTSIEMNNMADLNHVFIKCITKLWTSTIRTITVYKASTNIPTAPILTEVTRESLTLIFDRLYFEIDFLSIAKYECILNSFSSKVKFLVSRVHSQSQYGLSKFDVSVVVEMEMLRAFP